MTTHILSSSKKKGKSILIGGVHLTKFKLSDMPAIIFYLTHWHGDLYTFFGAWYSLAKSFVDRRIGPFAQRFEFYIGLLLAKWGVALWEKNYEKKIKKCGKQMELSVKCIMFV